MRKISLDDSCLNHLTNIPVGFTRKSSYIHTYILRNHIHKVLCILLTGGAYAPDATCIATPLAVIQTLQIYTPRVHISRLVSCCTIASPVYT